jgi:hypothetical protein
MRRFAIVPLLAALLAVPVPSRAEEMAVPPKVLLFEWETIRPGTSAAHDKVAAGYAALADKTKSPGHWIGLSAITGDENQALFVGGFPSFAAMQQWHEADEAAVEKSAALKAEGERLEKAGAALHVAQRGVLATYQPDISYHPPGHADMGKARFVEIIVTRVRPGRMPDYVDYMKALNEAREKAGVPGRVAGFQVVSGAQSGTVVWVHPMAALAELDGDYGKAIRAAIGDEQWKKWRLAFSEIVEESTRTLFAVNPKASRPLEAIVAADPAFWKPAAKKAKP